MKKTKGRVGLLGVFLSLVGLSAGAGPASIEGYAIAKKLDYLQVSPAVPGSHTIISDPNGPFHFVAYLSGSNLNLFSPSPSITLPNSTKYSLLGDTSAVGIEASYASKSALDGAIPSGSYTFTAGTSSLPLAFDVSDSYPAEIPQITSGIWDGQGRLVINATTGGSLTLNNFSNYSSGVGGMVAFSVYSVSGDSLVSELVSTQSMFLTGLSSDPLLTSCTIPAGLLQSDQTYYAELSFVRITDLITSSPPAVGMVMYFKSTGLMISTGTPASVPVFTQQPLSQTVTAGSLVTFTATASGTPTPTFQWRKGGVNVVGATSSAYTIGNVSVGDSGSYTVVATNSAGSVTSNPATLTVNLAVPVITWGAPAAITYGTALGGTQLNATANVPGSFFYSPASGTVLGAGVQTLSCIFTPTDTANYSAVSRSTTLTVTKAALSITAADTARTYGTANPEFTASYAGFVNGDTAAVLTGLTLSTTATLGSPVGTYPITPVGATTANYTITPLAGTLTVSAAPVTFSIAPTTFAYTGVAQGPVITPSIPGATYTTTGSATATNVENYSVSATASGNYTGVSPTTPWTITKATPVITWATPTAITYGTALGGTQLNATANVPGTFVYTPASGVVPGAGAQTLNCTFTPTDTTNYNPAPGSTTLAVNKATPAITWATPAAITFPTALSGTQLNATANVPGTFIYDPAPGTVLGGGVQTLNCTFTPTDPTNYNPTPGSTTLTVNKATPVITWATPAAITFPTALSGTQLNATANVPGTFAYNPASGTVLGAGVQVLNCTFMPTATANYNPTPGSTTLTVHSVPAITTQPIGHYVTMGANVTLTVAASGFPTPTYQWKKAGVDIPGATSSLYTITNAQLADGAVYTVVATNFVGSAASNATTLTVTTASLTPVLNDFTNDGNPDILWRNNVTGAFALWLMNGTVRQSAFIIGSAPLDWEVSGTGDFNADGQTDLLWRNPTTGTVAFWLMNGTALQSIVVTANVPTDWTIYGTGDFNNDGKVDILWRNPTSGTVAYWLMNGTAQQSVVVTTNVPTEWTIYGTGDFNNDGRVDILWRKPSTGDVAFWLMNGTALQSVVVTANVPTNWTIAGTGDYNNDGEVDILWQNYSTGGVAFWLMNGTAMQSAIVIGNIPADWLICN